jgi:cell wall-associated NlpC family hydrolase
MAIANPFTQQLQQFNSGIGNARRGIVDLYKLRSKGRLSAAKNISGLYKGEYNQLSALLGSNKAAFGAATQAGASLFQQNGYDIPGTQGEAAQLSGIVGKGAAPFEELSRTNLHAARGLSKTMGSLAVGEQNSLRKALPREQSAALSELEQGVVDTQTNLFQQGEQFDQQAAYNASLQKFYDASVANFAVGSGQSVSGGTVEAAARRYLGVPYKWGGTGPNAFDCSGLTQQVFADLGINLPRTAAQQQQATQLVGGLKSAQPGDLIFYGHPAHHVAIYIGNGMMIAAPHSGANVQVQQVYGSPEVRRVGGGGGGAARTMN